jgi:uncharacterized protein YndB with AHSA1/START domain
MLKKLFLSLVVLIGLVLIIAYFLPRDFRLSKSVVINAPRETVYDYVRFLKNQEKYSVWVMADPNVKMTYTGTDGTVGAISAWVSDDKNVGVGEQEIKALVPNEKMTVEIRFKKPMEGVNYADTTLESVGENQTKVTNTFYGSNPYPFNIMCQFMDTLIGGDMQKNMENLKKNLESSEVQTAIVADPIVEIKQKLLGTWQGNTTDVKRQLVLNNDGTYSESTLSGAWSLFTKQNAPSKFSSIFQNLEENKIYLLMVPSQFDV